MATFSKRKFSASTDGEPISVTATATPGTTVHTALASTEDDKWDEVWVYVTNISAAEVQITFEVGGTAAGNQIVAKIPAYTTQLVLPGIILQNGQVLAAFAGTTAVLNAFGWVNRIA